jgi:hypothetical protein
MSGLLSFRKTVFPPAEKNMVLAGYPALPEIQEPEERSYPQNFGISLTDKNILIKAPIVLSDFRDRSLWIPVVQSAYFTHTYGPLGQLTIDSVGPLGGDTNMLFSGLVCRKGIMPDDTGLIDIAFSMDGVAISSPGANVQWKLAILLSHQVASPSVGCTGIAASADSVFTHGFYNLVYTGSLQGQVALGNWGTSSGAMLADIASFRLRFQVLVQLSGATLLFFIDNPNATYEHNGAAPAALGGALSPTDGAIGNAMAALNKGFTLSVGAWNSKRTAQAGLTARLLSVEVLSGILI